MSLNDFELKRKKHFPIYVTFLVISMVIILLAIILLIFLDLKLLWWQFLLASFGSIFLIFLFIFLADYVEKTYFKKYGSLFQEKIIDPVIKQVFQDSLISDTCELDLSSVKLVGKSHKYQVLNEINTKDFQIYEISMLKDFRFRGFIVRKEVKNFNDSFIMTNYNYYFKPKIREFKIKTGINQFDNKYLLYSNDYNYQMPESLANNFLKKLINFKHIGVMVEDNVAYFVLGIRSSFSAEINLNLPLIDPINNDYVSKVRQFLLKLKAIGEFKFD
ncbi:MAG: hypothetical protein ACOX5X_00175 [Acholeplasmataceae bacterium]|jgi:energy-coupling factor transporter transmembrane protein EcfT